MCPLPQLTNCLYFILYVSFSFSLIKHDIHIYIYIVIIFYTYICIHHIICVYTQFIYFSNHWKTSCRQGMTFPKYFSIYFNVFPEYRTFSYIIQNKNQTQVRCHWHNTVTWFVDHIQISSSVMITFLVVKCFVPLA